VRRQEDLGSPEGAYIYIGFLCFFCFFVIYLCVFRCVQAGDKRQGQDPGGHRRVRRQEDRGATEGAPKL